MPFAPTLQEIKQLVPRFEVVSTFAGGGGSSTGYRMAGGKVLAINEFVESARKTYAANWEDTIILPGDIRQLTGAMILTAIGKKRGELDLFDGSPPCSGFSLAGNREDDWGKSKKYSDKSQRVDDLFFEYARLVGEIYPKVFIAENVKGLVMGEAANLLGSEQLGLFGEHEETIFHTLASKGYQVRYMVLNSGDFGVPQYRERLIIIGVRNDLGIVPTFPVWRIPTPTLRQALSGLLYTTFDLLECNIEKYAIYQQLKPLGYGEQSEKFFNLVKCDPDQPSPTLTQTAGCPSAACICHWDNRKFTVSEAKRIMSFPDDYILEGRYQEKIERLGRAVPPLLMKAVADHVFETILKKTKANEN